MPLSPVAGRWLRILGVALVVFVLPIVILLPAAPWLIETASTLGERSPAMAFVAVIVIFCIDAVAFIPNGLVASLAAGAMPWWLAALCVWIGLNVANSFSYALGAFAGRPLARRVIGAEDLAAAQQRANSVTSLVLFATRPVPVVGETILVAAGIASYPFRRFIVAIASANVFMTATYVGLGQLTDFLSPERIVLVATVGVPLIGAVLYGVVRLLRHKPSET